MKKGKLLLVSILTLISVACLSSCSFSSSHTHKYSSKWSFDETYHWHSAICSHLTETKDKEEHVFNSGVETIATYESAGFITYACTVCGYEKTEETTSALTHNYSNTLSYDENIHWYACTDEGYEDLKTGEESHALIEDENLYNGETGVATYKCACGYSKEYLRTTITTYPTVETAYIGQKLSDITLSGGESNVKGTFAWTAPDTVVTESGEYSITFAPNNSEYATITGDVSLTATQLTITVTVGENGSADHNGTINVNYGGELTISFTPNSDYTVNAIVVDNKGADTANSYTFSNITSSHTISVTFVYVLPESLTITYGSGTQNAYTYDTATNTLTFTTISADSFYQISGEFNGNIVIDVGNDYKFELEMLGLTITSSTSSPIIILSGDEVALTAKKDYKNYIYDTRDAIDDDNDAQYSGAIYSKVDLVIKGKGYLTVISDNNNGIHTKKDLEVKNLTLYVKCIDNALKGNDSVTICGGTITLIARQGDGIKTTDSDVSSKGNQRGIVWISGGNVDIYAACDGIDASYNVVISGSPVINIYTDKYSEYSEEVTYVSEETYYLRYTSNSYKFSIKYYNSDTDYEWVNVDSTSYKTVTSSSNSRPGQSTTYYYYTFAKISNYSKMKVYMYSSSQTQGQDSSYYACSSAVSTNENYDTITLTYRNGSLSASWTNYTVTSNPGQGGPGGNMQEEGNTDKGNYSTKGIKADNEILISGGTITIKSYDDAIHTNNDVLLGDEDDDSDDQYGTGNITISGGTLTLYSNDDGIHADGTLTISGGTITITNSYEGIEGEFIVITNGTISVTSSDDGLNATTTSGDGITISGGTIYVYACGDGLDSNSTDKNGGILFKGGYVTIVCNSNGNSAIDTENGYTHTGGIVVAIMTTGGMTSETTNGNSIGRTTKSSLSLSKDNYVVVTVDSEMVAVVQMPCSMTAYVVYLGSNSATISSATTTDATLDSNGVYWNK